VPGEPGHHRAVGQHLVEGVLALVLAEGLEPGLELDPLGGRLGGRRRRGERGVQRETGEFQIPLGLGRRHLLRRRHGVEPVGGQILGQHLGQGQFHPQRVAEGVLVLDAVQPTDQRAALGAEAVAFGVGEAGPDPLQERRPVGRRRLGLVLGGHLPVLDPPEHDGPLGGRGRVGEVGLQGGQVEPALGGDCVVTGDAVAVQEPRRSGIRPGVGPGIVRRAGSGRESRLCGGENRGQGQQGRAGPPQSGWTVEVPVAMGSSEVGRGAAACGRFRGVPPVLSS
jgi:hypothetical protein